MLKRICVYSSSLDSHADDARSFGAILCAFDCSGDNSDDWKAKCDDFYPLVKMLTGLRCSWSGQKRPVWLQAYGLVKFIFVLAGLDGCDACLLETFLVCYLMSIEWLDVMLVTRELLLGANWWCIERFFMNDFSQFLTLKFFQINFGKSFLKFHLILECFFKGFFWWYFQLFKCNQCGTEQGA